MQQINIRLVLQKLVVNGSIRGTELITSCLFANHKHDADHPAFSINLEKNGVFNCFKCGESGNIYNIIAKKTGENAVKWLIANNFLEPKEKDLKNSSPTVVVGINKTPKENLEFLLRNGFITRVLQDDYALASYQLAKKRGKIAEFLQKNEDTFIVKRSFNFNNKEITAEFGDILFIYKNKQNQVTNLKLQKIDIEKKDCKYNIAGGIIKSSFFSSFINKNQHLVLVVEGEMDALACNYFGFNAVAVGSLGTINSAVLELNKQNSGYCYIAVPDAMEYEDYGKRFGFKEYINSLLTVTKVYKNKFKTDVKCKDICEFSVNDVDFTKYFCSVLYKNTKEIAIKLQDDGTLLYIIDAKDRYLFINNDPLLANNDKVLTEILSAYLFGDNPIFSHYKTSDSFAGVFKNYFKLPSQSLKRIANPSIPYGRYKDNLDNYFFNEMRIGGLLLEKNQKNSQIKRNLTDFPNILRLIDNIILTKSANMPQYRAFLLDFLAYKFQYPEKKDSGLATALLFGGRAGIGKSFFTQSILPLLYGSDVVGVVGAKGLAGFNGHLAGKLWAVYDDLPEKNAKNIYDDSKEFSSSEYILVEKKGKDAIKLRNFANIIITTNNTECLPISVDERRYVVFSSFAKARSGAEIVDILLKNNKEVLNREINLFAEYLLQLDVANFKERSHLKTTESLELIENTQEPITKIIGDFLAKTQDFISTINSQKSEKKQILLDVAGNLKDGNNNFWLVFLPDGKIEFNFNFLKSMITEALIMAGKRNLILSLKQKKIKEILEGILKNENFLFEIKLTTKYFNINLRKTDYFCTFLPNIDNVELKEIDVNLWEQNRKKESVLQINLEKEQGAEKKI